jgi:L-fuconolactonase
MVQDIADDDWLARAELAPAFEAMIAHQLVFDALLKTRHLRRLIAVLERHPQLRVVIDHAAKPAIAGGADAAWRSDIAAVAQFPEVACKLSGLVTEAPSGLHSIKAPHAASALCRSATSAVLAAS